MTPINPNIYVKCNSHKKQISRVSYEDMSPVDVRTIEAE